MYPSFRHLRSFFWLGALLLLALSPCVYGGTPVTVLASFLDSNGAKPYAPLVQSTDGNLYGATLEGGANSQGAIFRTTPSGQVTLLVSFNGAGNGAQPHAGLLHDPISGNFYGTTSAGGPNGSGTVFRITSTGVLTNLASFCATNGAQ